MKKDQEFDTCPDFQAPHRHDRLYILLARKLIDHMGLLVYHVLLSRTLLPIISNRGHLIGKTAAGPLSASNHACLPACLLRDFDVSIPFGE